MIEVILISFILAKIKGYHIKPIFKQWQFYPVIIFSVMYIIMQVDVFMGGHDFIKYSKNFETIYILSFLFLIFKFKRFYSAVYGSICIFIGTLLNKIVISANGGKMPVFPNLSYMTGYVRADSFSNPNDIHILGNEATKLKLLSDIFDTGYSIMSIGDIFIRLFTLIVLLSTIKYLNIGYKRENTIFI